MAQARETYEALNRQLLTELPELNDRAVLVLELATRSLAAARLYFQGHLAKLYLELTAVCFAMNSSADSSPSSDDAHPKQKQPPVIIYLSSDISLSSRILSE